MNGLPTHPPPGIAGMSPRPMMATDNVPSLYPPAGAMTGQFRGFAGPNGIPMPPGINGVGRSMPPPSRGFTLESTQGLPYTGQPPIVAPVPGSQQSGRSVTHSRQPSESVERSHLDAQSLPFARPQPIKRPSSPPLLDQHKEQKAGRSDTDDLSTQLGSSALLDDTDIPLSSSLSQSLPAPPGAFGPSRASFGTSSLFVDPLVGK
jgi:hypothetical protein